MAPSDTEEDGRPRRAEHARDRTLRRDDRVPGHRRRRPGDRAAARPADGCLALGRGGRRAPIDHRCVAPTLPLGAHRHGMGADADLSPRGLAGWSSKFLERLELETSPWSATTPAVPSSNSHRRWPGAGQPDRARLLRRVRQLPARPDRPNAGPTGKLPPAGSDCSCSRCGCGRCDDSPSRSDGRRSEATPPPPMDEAGPEPARDPPRHRPGAASDRGGPDLLVDAATGLPASTARPSSSGRPRTA